MQILANLIDIHKERIYPAKILVEDGRISSVSEINEKLDTFVLPGFIDAHIHIESSMVAPLAFSRTAIKHGTVGTVSDPHEIANVVGVEGVKFMIRSAKQSPMKILFGAPSCVPATEFESSGYSINSEMIGELLDYPEIGYLSEMMNYPGVIFQDTEVLKKLSIAREKGLPVDGHAPGISGEDLRKYVMEGISTDHECFSIEEALEKISHGMKILIREGSGAKNFEALIPLLNTHPGMVMLCSDDLHPDDLIKGHINLLVKRALIAGYNLFDVLRASSSNAVNHYKLNVGLLRENDPADFIIIDSMKEWNVLSTYINGKAYFENGSVKINNIATDTINNFNISKIEKEELEIKAISKKINIIRAIDGELITKRETLKANIKNGKLISDVSRDILKMTVINRYVKSSPAVAFIKGFGLKQGAMASSIAHDSHNIICVGTSDQEMTETINWIIKNKGGIAVNNGKEIMGLPLEIAGIMSVESVENAAYKYSRISAIASDLGSSLQAPFMTLAFMALLVIPELKLSDKGLFDGTNFSFISLFVEE